jgi:hypothetical protein
MVFLLVWDKDSYTGIFFVLFPCTCVLQPTLVHLYQTSSLLPGHLPIMASASLRLLHLFLYSTFLHFLRMCLGGFSFIWLWFAVHPDVFRFVLKFFRCL